MLQEETADVEAAIGHRAVQWGALTEKKQKNQHAQAEFLLHQQKKEVRSRHLLSFAPTSALYHGHCRRRWQMSRLPKEAEICSGVR